jgi:proteic killer suppression protein
LHGKHATATITTVIVSFGDAATEALYHGAADRRTRRFPRDIVKVILRKLDMLEAASKLEDLRAPPGNRLEALRGDLRGEHSVRVNDQWRIVFRWTPQGPSDVRLMDYH